jgi:Flp pilus assembly protein protease CpaA
VRVDVPPRGEVGDLAAAFNTMTADLVDQRDRLVQAERVAAWRELARRLAHELKNPLFPMRITVENLQRAKVQAPELFEEVFEESARTLVAELNTLNAIIGPPAGGLKFALLGFAAGFGSYLLLYVLHAMGAGDVKLMAAVGALVGWQNWLAIVVLTALLGGVAAIAVAVARKRVWATFFNIKYILGETMHGRAAYADREEVDVKSSKSLGLPHGAVIAAATVVFLSVGAYYGYGR